MVWNTKDVWKFSTTEPGEQFAPFIMVAIMTEDTRSETLKPVYFAINSALSKCYYYMKTRSSPTTER